ncbi:uncharacterized protein OCT59_013047 [Rhizophagus irregularis]|uniref:Uncharacterized protein n=1 Tax=Rhizophagus irregularis TaxID=588596 RepID=A0A916E8G8_9GLOM|nr:hypothetical protein OCT59_013047 [Rhizophagus irregularis]GBC31726.1 hypothetical protein GLOIN_2v1764592 [Rhizophagus irregularis DAOM 181602=DAOM 197198]CAB4477597.1 unnamed protein product [Rhizophagus irregularis]CAB5204548.1 unnamed protein product [Rhizophagus irregularis]CAB5368054.1 unnamed protein product [Rhizophagus irregularis]
MASSFSNQTSNAPSESSFIDNQLTVSTSTVNLSSYNRIIHRRRNQRQLRREIKYPLNHIRRLPTQITSDPFANQFFNGSPF